MRRQHQARWRQTKRPCIPSVGDEPPFACPLNLVRSKRLGPAGRRASDNPLVGSESRRSKQPVGGQVGPTVGDCINSVVGVETVRGQIRD